MVEVQAARAFIGETGHDVPTRAIEGAVVS